MAKKDFFIDMDGVITNSVKAYCSVYNHIWSKHPRFKYADWTRCQEYNLTDVCPLESNPLAVFESPLFFKNLEFMEESTYEMLEVFNEKYNLIICTIGNYNNISLKSQWIKKNLPFIKDVIFLSSKDCSPNKAQVNMNSAIFVDDHPENLYSSNASFKICYGQAYPWKINCAENNLVAINNEILIWTLALMDW